MCVDCCTINKIIIKYPHIILKLDNVLNELHGSCTFTKIDMKSGYCYIRMKLGDERNIAFKKNYLYKWVLMPFKLTKAPSTFIRIMNLIFHKFLGKFIIV